MSISGENCFEGEEGSNGSSLFSIPKLDIPVYQMPGYGSGNTSTHTTPLNYMHKPSNLARKVDYISERDYISDRDSEDFDKQMSKLSAGISDDFFQLQSQNSAELEELEPSIGEIPRDRTVANAINNSSVNFLDGTNLVDTVRKFLYFDLKKFFLLITFYGCFLGPLHGAGAHLCKRPPVRHSSSGDTFFFDF